jgi:hypothetical protein
MSQTIQTDRLRISGPWGAWAATLVAIGTVTWAVASFKGEMIIGMRMANEGLKSAVLEIRGLRDELKETRSTLSEHELQIREHRSRIQNLELRSGKPTSEGW